MSHGRAPGAALALALALAVQPGPAARAQAIGQGFELERAGRHAQAAEVYLRTLSADPANLPALLGLERVLPALGRLPELLPLSRRALAADPGGGDAGISGVLLRTQVALGQLDSAEVFALSWAEAAPRDEVPYREWALALAAQRQLAEARRVLLLGRRALGRPTALAAVLADLLQHTGDWEGAAREWASVVTATPAQIPNAASQFADTPLDQRERVARVLTGADASGPARQLGGELLLGWGDPMRAWAVFDAAVGLPSAAAAQALRRFAERAGALGTPAGHRVRGLALGRYAEMAPPPVAARARVDVVRAFLAAGDRAAARGILELLAADADAPADAQALAQAALLRVLIDEGRLDDAAGRLAEAGDRLPGDERAALRLALARAFIARGELARADSVLVRDSSVEAMALKGWAALYRGDLREALDLFRTAGPYAGERREATERTAMLALLQRIPEDRSPALGGALLTLARGDSVEAIRALRQAAERLDADGGRPEVLLLAGQIAARLDGGEATAAALFEDVVRTGGAGAAAPAAELEWSRLLLRQGRVDEAVRRLEHLILTYPTSAHVPEARRELERARGAIPRS